jgi:hypothetical protein
MYGRGRLKAAYLLSVLKAMAIVVVGFEMREGDQNMAKDDGGIIHLLFYEVIHAMHTVTSTPPYPFSLHKSKLFIPSFALSHQAP